MDTNIFIAVKNREVGYRHCEKILDAIDDGILDAIVSAVVVAEVLVGFYRNNEISEARKFLNHLMQRYIIKPVDLEIADMSAKIRNQGLKLPDAMVIATAMLTNSILITKDRNMRYPNLEILSPEKFLEKYRV